MKNEITTCINAQYTQYIELKVNTISPPIPNITIPQRTLLNDIFRNFICQTLNKKCIVQTKRIGQF
jgi:hypothetical protein